MPRDWPDPDDKPVSKAEFWIIAILTLAGPASVLTWLLS